MKDKNDDKEYPLFSPKILVDTIEILLDRIVILAS